jgi:membrane protease YdiL (CAAX protease family)
MNGLIHERSGYNASAREGTMTTKDDFDDDAIEGGREEPTPESSSRVAAPPRVWPVFVVFPLALAVVLAVQIVLIVGLVIWHVANGANPERLFGADLMDLLTEPVAFIGLLLAGQLVMGAAAIVPAILSREPTLSRLGLTKPSLPIWGYPIIMLGSGIPWAAGMAFYFALGLVMTPDQSFEMFYKKITWPVAGPFLLFVALAPGFVEEMLFRGYIQRRLLKRWSPWAAILVSSALFALVHLAPHHVLYVFPIGIWLGVIAWRTESVWPCIACHALINASISIYATGHYLAGWPEIPPIAVCILFGGLAIGGFIGSIWLLARSRPVTANREDEIPTVTHISPANADRDDKMVE